MSSLESQETERFLSVIEAARFLAVSRAFFYKYSRQIPHYRIGGAKNGKLIFRASELAEWAEQRRVTPPNTPKAG